MQEKTKLLSIHSLLTIFYKEILSHHAIYAKKNSNVKVFPPL